MMIKINKYKYEPKYFPDGTFMLLDFSFENLYNTRKNYITWAYDNIEEQILLYNIVKHIRTIDKTLELDLILPYVPNARMDRIKSEKEIFTLKHFCDFINDLEFDNVYIIDCHSNVAYGMLNNVKEYNGVEYKIINGLCTRCCNIYDYIKTIIYKINPDILYYIDNGGANKYSKIFDKPHMFGFKQRDWKTGILSKDLQIIGEHPSKQFNVLIIDDIIVYGNSALIAANKLKEIGANNIYMWVTHMENSILDGEFYDNGNIVNLLDSDIINKFYTTNSIFRGQHSLVEIIDVIN